jgi:catechol-2,3-dioxygenase
MCCGSGAVRRGANAKAGSVYFKDPERNGFEVFCDPPSHVQQPVVMPWDRNMNDEELPAHIEKLFSDKPGFTFIEEWAVAHAKKVDEG